MEEPVLSAEINLFIITMPEQREYQIIKVY